MSSTLAVETPVHDLECAKDDTPPTPPAPDHITNNISPTMTPPSSADSIVIPMNEASQTYDEGIIAVSKETLTITKLLFAVSVAAILVNANNAKGFNSWVACLEVTVHLMAIIFMTIGIYIRLKWPKMSTRLQRLGHLICMIFLMLIRTPLIELPLAYLWFPPFLVLVVLTTVIYFSD